MAEIVDFQDAVFNAGLRKVLGGTAAPATDEQIARYAAEGAALIREESGITKDNISAVTMNETTLYWLKRR